MTAFPWLVNGDDTRAFCVAMADRGVLLAPGDCFEMANHFRLGFGVLEQGFDEALSRISDYLMEYQSSQVSLGVRATSIA